MSLLEEANNSLPHWIPSLPISLPFLSPGAFLCFSPVSLIACEQFEVSHVVHGCLLISKQSVSCPRSHADTPTCTSTLHYFNVVNAVINNQPGQ